MTDEPTPAASVHTLPLDSRESLERALDGFTRPSSEELARLAALEGLELRQALYRASDAVTVLDGLMLQVQDAAFCLQEALQTATDDTLGDEYDWASMLNSLCELPEQSEQLQVVGLVKYRRYLHNRLQALEALQAPEPVPTDEPALPSLDELALDDELDLSDLDLDADLPLDDAVSYSQSTLVVGTSRASREASDASLAGTASSEPVEREQQGTAKRSQGSKVVRLHRGRPVALAIKGRSEIEIWMGRSHFRLLLNDGLQLLTAEGECGRLRNGRNLVGRSPDCEIMISQAHDTVSRVHLEMAVEQGRLVSVTDLSSGGTYVRPELLEGSSFAA